MPLLRSPARADRATDALTPAAITAARAHAARTVRRSRSSFFWAMRLLPHAKREAMFALYAYCRHIDDIADTPGSAHGKLEQLAAWREEIAALAEGRPSHPLAVALAEPMSRFGLPADELLTLIDGMEMDAAAPLRAPDGETLQAYCRKVAGAVGLLAIHIFGRPQARSFALTLGEALQLTNILRDLAEDAEMGRLYLPREALQAAGIAGDEPETVLRHPALPKACAIVAARAEALYAAAEAALREEDRRDLAPAIVMLAVYRRLLRRLEARGWHVLEPRLSLSVPEKVWLVLRHLVTARP